MLKTRNGDTIGTPIEPLSVDIPGACQLTGLGRSKLYELLGKGQISSVKVGKRRLILVADLRAWLQRLANAQRGGLIAKPRPGLMQMLARRVQEVPASDLVVGERS
jgi:excisionase family DNA binding protein